MGISREEKTFWFKEWCSIRLYTRIQRWIRFIWTFVFEAFLGCSYTERYQVYLSLLRKRQTSATSRGLKNLNSIQITCLYQNILILRMIWCQMSRILLYAFCTQVTAMSIFEQGVIDGGVCHRQEVTVGVYYNCDPNTSAALNVIIAQNREPTDNQNYNIQCPARTKNNTWICFPDGFMRLTSETVPNTLNFTFIFNHPIHAGRFLRIVGSCNGTREKKDILLRPCVSGFSSSAAFYNSTTATLRCDHLNFNYSNTPMMIKERGGNDHGSCLRNNTCTPGCQRIADGLHCLVPYMSGRIYQCVLDGAVYNITDVDTVPTALPDTTTQRTTTPRTPGTSHRSTESSNGISTSLLSTSVNDKASIYMVFGLLVVSFVRREFETWK